MFFVSTFTVGTGAVVLLVLAEQLFRIELAFLAGAVLSDFLIFRYVRNKLNSELHLVFEYVGGNHIKHVLHSKYFSWMLPDLGTVIIASPLPDEIGVSLDGYFKNQHGEICACFIFIE